MKYQFAEQKYRLVIDVSAMTRRISGHHDAIAKRSASAGIRREIKMGIEISVIQCASKRGAR